MPQSFIQRCCRAIILSMASCVLPVASVNAALELELTQGIDSALPIAVVPFSGVSTDPIVDAIMRADLGNSGRFRIYDVSKIQQKPTNVREINYNYWKGLNLNDIVIGNVTAKGSNYQIDMDLVDVFAGNAPGTGVLVSQEYQVKTNQVRSLAHHLSDVVYQKLTGERGIFSTRIAYVLVDRTSLKDPKYFLEVADYDGFNPQRLLMSNQPIMSPSWSPDGKKIVYVSFQKRRSAIYVVDVTNGKQTLISEAPGINGAPAWSPDGRQLALVLFQGNNPKIFIKDLNSDKLRQITQGVSIDTEPSWSPDGKSLLFTSDRGGSAQVYEVNLANNQVKRVTFSGSYNASASYTPDGKNIVLLQGGRDGFNIAVQSVTNGRVRVLTDSGSASSPSIAPNGSMIIYGDGTGRGTLGMVSLDGRVKLRLPARDGSVQEPAWSPFFN